MLKELLNDLISLGKQIDSFAAKQDNVREYNNEFDGEQWTASYPALFVEVLGFDKLILAADKKNLSQEMYFALYVGARTDDGEHPLDIVDKIYALFNGYELEYDDSGYTITIGVTNFYGRDVSQKAYQITGYVSK